MRRPPPIEILAVSDPGTAQSPPDPGAGAARGSVAEGADSAADQAAPPDDTSSQAADGPGGSDAAADASLAGSVATLDGDGGGAWQTAGDFQILGGAPADAIDGEGDYFFADNVLHILSSTPMTVRTAKQTVQTIDIDPGVQADLTLDGVNIQTTLRAPINLVNNVYDIAANDGVAEEDRVKATHADQIRHKTTLHLTLADGSSNTLNYTQYGAAGWSGIRTTWGTELTIDDSVRNVTADGRTVTPANGVVPYDATLSNGKEVKAGDSPSVMDSENPGKLTVRGSGGSAGIGGATCENAGAITINGGIIHSSLPVRSDGLGSGAAGIGGGSCGSGTLIVINGGNITSIAAHCGSGIGAGTSHMTGGGVSYAKEDAIETKVPREQSSGYTWYGKPSKEDCSAYTRYPNSECWMTVAGDIYINGGFVDTRYGAHGNALGQSCAHDPSTNKGHVIVISGGTVLTTSAVGSDFMYDIGAQLGYTVVTGGSVKVSSPKKFTGLGGTAYSTQGVTSWDDVDAMGGALPDKDKVFMVTVDLSADGVKNNPIESWKLTVGGDIYDYGAPAQFDNGKLYLWLPEDAKNKVIAADLSYRAVNADGEVQTVTPTTMYRDPNSPADPKDPDRTKLKRYEEFEIDPAWEAALDKYYDGLPFPAYTWDGGTQIVPPQDPDHPLTDPTAIDYTYQVFESKDGPAITGELFGGDQMPSDAGVMRLTMVSREYSSAPGFMENFWGHRAYGWCTIRPIASVVRDVKAEWLEEPEGSADRPGDVGHPANHLLVVSAVVERAATVDGTPSGESTAETCQAPQGRVQLYVDGVAVGEPVALEVPAEESVSAYAGLGAAPTVTCTPVPNAAGGSSALVRYTFAPSALGGLPDTSSDEHEVTLRFLPPDADQMRAGVPANYLASADPTQDEDSEWADATVEPMDPNPSAEKDPGSPGKVEVSPDPAPADPDDPRSTTYEGTITAKWEPHEPGEPNPGRVTVKISTDSDAPVTVTAEDGTVITADVVRDEDGNPVRDEDGKLTLWVDPETPGETKLVVRQEPSASYGGTVFDFDVTVGADPSVAPEPAMELRVENLTHPDGPTQPGDRLRYTVVASNGAPGSLWTDVEGSVALPPSVQVDEGSVALVSGSGTRTPLSKAPGSAGEGQFALSGSGAKPSISAPMGDIGGGTSRTLVFEAVVDPDLDVRGGDPDDLDLSSEASATGTRPSEDDPNAPMPDPDDPSKPLPVTAGPTAPQTPPGPGRVVPADPKLPGGGDGSGGDGFGDGDVSVAKAAENLTRSDGRTLVGDRLRYTVRVANTGASNCALYSAMVSDPLPEGVELVPGTIALKLSDGRTLPVDDAAYDAESRTVAAMAGDLWGGDWAELSFECEVGEAALDAENANVAYAYGALPSADPDRDGTPEGEKPGSPAVEPGGDLVVPSNASEVPVAESDPVLPPGVEPDQPAPPADEPGGEPAGPADGGAQPAAPPKPSTLTILREMATTGDPLAAAALSLTAAALLAGGAALAARRRRTR